MGPSHPYRSLPLDLPLMLEGGDPQWFSFLQNPFPITLVLDGFGNPADGKNAFLAKTLPETSFLPKTSHHHLNYSTHLFALSHLKRWNSLCVLIPLTAHCFKFCSKPRKAPQSLRAAPPPSTGARCPSHILEQTKRRR